jgi:flagellar biogenesis protein FliO
MPSPVRSLVRRTISLCLLPREKRARIPQDFVRLILNATGKIFVPVALVLLLFLVSQGRLLAQTLSDNTVPRRSSVADAAKRPAWADTSWGPSQGPVKVAPPLPRRDDKIAPVSFEETPAAGNGKINALKPGAASVPLAAAGSATLHDNQPTISPPTADRKSSLSLSPPGKTNTQNSSNKTKSLPSPATILSSLGIVIGIFLLLVWILRRAAPPGLARLPNEAFELLGRAPLAGKQQVHLLRCGNKLLLVSVTPAGTETLTEITEPLEVDRLAGLCRQNQPHSSTAAFRQIFEQLAPKRPSRNALAKSEYGDYDSSGIELSGAMDWEERNV